MNGSPALPQLLTITALAVTFPLVTPSIAQSPASVSLSVNGGDPIEVESEALPVDGGTVEYVGEIAADGAWSVSWSLDVDPDPEEESSINGTVVVSNDTNQTKSFVFVLDAPLCPVIETESLMGAYFKIAMVTDADGGAVESLPDDAVWTLRSGDAAAASLFFDPFTLNASGAGNLSTSSSFGEPFPSSAGPAFETSMGLRLAFTLSGGETVTFTNLVILDTDPANLVACDDGGGDDDGDGDDHGGDDDGDDDAAEPMGESAEDKFGRTVAPLGDVDDDGVNDLAVGAPFNDDGAPDAGKVYVYSGATGALIWSHTGDAEGDQFGFAIACAGDADGDEVDDLVVGAPYSSVEEDEAGTVYVLSGMDGTRVWTKHGKDAGDRFGHAVSGGIDIDGDDRADFLAGAPFNDDAGSNAGRAYVYSGATGSKLKSLKGISAGDKFGWAVAVIGKVTGDELGDFAVGAPNDDDAADNAGSVFVFAGESFELLYQSTGAQQGEQFGRSIAGVGRADGDGRDDLAVGAPFADRGARVDAGRVELLSGKTGERIWNRKGNGAGDRLGWSVAAAGDVNVDGASDVILAAPWHDGAGQDAGRVFVRSGAGGGKLATMSGATDDDRFGYAVCSLAPAAESIDVTIVVGAPNNDDNGANSGRVYIESMAPAGATASCSDDQNGDGAVDIEDLLILLGDDADDTELIGMLGRWGACPGE